MQQPGMSVEDMLDQVTERLVRDFGEIIRKQARDLTVANAHVVNLQHRLGQAEAALSELQRVRDEEPVEGSADQSDL